MTCQVMQDLEGDYYIVSDRKRGIYWTVFFSMGMFQAIDAQPDEIQHLHAQPELSATKLAYEWFRRPCTWEALRILREAIDLKLPGDLPPTKEYVKKEFKIGEFSSKVSINRVTLAEICLEHKWEPSVARRLLRKAGLQPAGRWEWDKSAISPIITLISQGYR